MSYGKSRGHIYTVETELTTIQQVTKWNDGNDIKVLQQYLEQQLHAGQGQVWTNGIVAGLNKWNSGRR